MGVNGFKSILPPELDDMAGGVMDTLAIADVIGSARWPHRTLQDKAEQLVDSVRNRAKDTRRLINSYRVSIEVIGILNSKLEKAEAARDLNALKLGQMVNLTWRNRLLYLFDPTFFRNLYGPQAQVPQGDHGKGQAVQHQDSDDQRGSDTHGTPV